MNKILGSLLLAGLMFLFAIKAEQPQMVYLKYVKCNFSSKIAYKNYSCSAKSYNRSYSVGTVLAWTKAPVNSIYVEVVFQFKYGVVYREALRVKRFDWCEAMQITSGMNILTKFFVNMVNESVPALIHPCPYTKINIEKASVKTSTVASIFPSGDYKNILIITDAKENFLGQILFVATVNSTNKDTFG